MAEDKLMFPIGFNLDEGIRKADNEWKNGKANQLSNLLKKTPVDVKLKFDITDNNALDKVRQRLKGLKLEPITPETKQAIRELAIELQTLAKALEKIQKINATNASASSPDAVRAARINDINQRSAARVATEHERARAAAARAEAAELRLAQARQRSATSARNSVQAVRQTTAEYGNQLGYIDRLIRRMAVLWSLSFVGNFVSRLREVTAEFELQRVSLGAIIQDQSRANQLFSEIKSFALQSPLTIMDLTKYTKQLAAYKIETEELFDTTKRLADVSVGLGVSFDRIVLAYGQIRARSLLVASEARQLTEAGIPITELLAEKLTEVNGKLVSTADVMKMMEKRMISFEMVKEIFEDMTSAGGLFYNMQEKQSQTLFGMWSKLGDAAAVMYDEMGNNAVVNATMKSFIGTIESLLRNWRLLAGVVGSAGAAMLQYAVAQKVAAARQSILNVVAAAQERVNQAEIAYNALLKQQATLEATATATQRQSIAAKVANAKATLDLAIAERKAAQSVTLFSKAWNGIKSFFVGNWTTLAVAAVGAIGSAIYNAYEKANRLNNALEDIKKEGNIESEQSAYNFKRLADKAVEAADGSKQQKDALDELHRTYRDMIPVQDMTIEKLREMKGNYNSLTKSIKENIAQRMLEKEINAIIENYAEKIKDSRDSLTNLLKSGYVETIDFVGGYEVRQGVKIPVELDENAAREISKRIREISEDSSKSAKEVLTEAIGEFYEITPAWQEFIDKVANGQTEFTALVNIVRGMNAEIERIKEQTEEARGVTGEYKEAWEKTQEAIENITVAQFPESKYSEQFLQEQDRINQTILRYVDLLKSALQKEGVAIEESWINIVNSIDANDPSKITTIQFDRIIESIGSAHPKIKNLLKIIQDEYDNKLVPSDKTNQVLRKMLTNYALSFKYGLDNVKSYLIKSGEDGEAYAKRMKDSLAEVSRELKQMIRLNLLISQHPELGLAPYSQEEIDKQKEVEEFLKKATEMTKEWDKSATDSKKKGSKGTKQDPRLQNLKEEISLVQKLYQEYKQLEKQEGGRKAAEDLQRMAKTSLDNLSKKYGISLPKTAKYVADALEILYGKMAALPKKTFKTLDKDLAELRWTIEKVNIDDAQAKIEKQLKLLQERVSRTKTAKEFYDRILNLTGDYEMSAEVTMSIYNGTGDTLQKDMAEHLQKIFGSFDVEVPVGIITDGKIDFRALDDYLAKSKEAEEYLLTHTGISDEKRKELQQMIIPESQFEQIRKMADEWRKSSEKQYEQWIKDLEKAKSYSDKRIELARYTEKQIADIEEERIAAVRKMESLQASGSTDEDTKKKIEAQRYLIEQYEKMQDEYRQREKKEASKLDYEAFKDMPMYVQMFDNLDNASTKMLTNMRQKLVAMQEQWKNLSPTELKELQSRLNEIDQQLARRNPFKTLADSLKEYKKLRKQGTRSEAEENLKEATDAYLKAKDDLKAAIEEYGAGSEEAEDAQKVVDNTEKAQKEAEKLAENWKKVEDAIGLSANEIFAIMGSIGDALHSVADLTEAFGGSEEDVQYWNDLADGIDKVTSSLGDMMKSIMSGNVAGIITTAITAVPNMIIGFMDIFSAGKVKRANKEIKRQQELLEQLQYTYKRLQKAQESALGNEYINTYQNEIKNLQAQAKAYQKQAAAERSKGKKADKEKIKEFEKAYRDTMDEIKDMQNEIENYFLGTDVTSAARDFAKSWLDAKLSFAETTEAMKEKFADMMQTMIIEAMAAEVMKAALQPLYNYLHDATEDGVFSTDEMIKAADLAVKQAGVANDAMEIFYNNMEAAGFDWATLMQDADNQLTGISRDIATASEESINGLAQGITTQNFYISQIHANVAMIAQVMMNGYTPAINANDISLTDLVTLQNQHLANLPQIAANTAATVERCERAAVACENISDQLARVIKPKGTQSGFVLQTSIN